MGPPSPPTRRVSALVMTTQTTGAPVIRTDDPAVVAEPVVAEPLPEPELEPEPIERAIVEEPAERAVVKRPLKRRSSING